MLKKTVVLGSILTAMCAAPTLANPANFKSGFLAGGHVGASFGSGRFNSNFDTNDVNLGVSSVSGRANKTSALFGVLGGYRHVFQEGYTIGFDISANIFTNNELKKQLTHDIGADFPFDNKLSRRFSVIPSINFGKTFCGRWHVALGLGLGVSRFHQHVYSVDFNTTGKSSTTKLGFVPSVGVEYAATQNISITGSLSYEIYKKVHKKFDTLVPELAGSSYTSSISPRYLTLKVGAVYRF